MTNAFSTPHNRKMTLILLAICGLLAIAAVAVGIDDNLPGIILPFLRLLPLSLHSSTPGEPQGSS